MARPGPLPGSRWACDRAAPLGALPLPLKGITIAVVLSGAVWCGGFTVAFAWGPSIGHPTSNPPLSVSAGQFSERSKLLGESTRDALRTILRRNLGVGLVAISGIATGGLTTINALVANGALTGLVMGSYLREGLHWSLLVRYTAPHLIELLGIWLSAGAGLRGAWLVIGLLLLHQPRRRCDWTEVTAYALGGLAIVALAAALEAYVTLREFY